MGGVKKGLLEFLEPKDGEFYELEIELSDKDAEELAKLIEIVYEKIMNLDFPDTSGYSKDMKGIQKFREDLVGGGI